jgi:hypothetical protein
MIDKSKCCVDQTYLALVPLLLSPRAALLFTPLEHLLLDQTQVFARQPAVRLLQVLVLQRQLCAGTRVPNGGVVRQAAPRRTCENNTVMFAARDLTDDGAEDALHHRWQRKVVVVALAELSVFAAAPGVEYAELRQRKTVVPTGRHRSHILS